MKVAILYISTGKYIVFWDEFYTSSEKYFLPQSSKEYFVFTDSETIPHQEGNNVHIIPHKQLGWPYDTLMRFHVFSQIEDQLKSFDYVFFFNANMLFVSPVTEEEFLPTGKTDDGLMVTLHPGYFNQPVEKFPYENSEKDSLAFIPPGEGKNYFMGGLNGGISKSYIELILSLKENTQKDLDNHIIAKWHDESHLNRYMIGRNPKILSPAFGYPEGRKLPFEPKIIIRDKTRYGGHDFLRNLKSSPWKKFRIFVKKIKNRL